MITKEEKILSKFYDIGATEIEVNAFWITVSTNKDPRTLNYEYVIRFDKREKTYQKYKFISKGDVWRYYFNAAISYPITEAENRIISELFDYWREEEWKQKKKKLK